MDTFVANKGVWGTFFFLYILFLQINLHNQLQLNIVSGFFSETMLFNKQHLLIMHQLLVFKSQIWSPLAFVLFFLFFNQFYLWKIFDNCILYIESIKLLNRIFWIWHKYVLPSALNSVSHTTLNTNMFEKQDFEQFK